MTAVIYTKPNCPYCAAAKEDFAARGEAFVEKDATRDPFHKRELMRFSKKTGVVPTIVRDGGADVQVGFPPGSG
jgi:glutaredoxin